MCCASRDGRTQWGQVHPSSRGVTRSDPRGVNCKSVEVSEHFVLSTPIKGTWSPLENRRPLPAWSKMGNLHDQRGVAFAARIGTFRKTAGAVTGADHGFCKQKPARHEKRDAASLGQIRTCGMFMSYLRPSCNLVLCAYATVSLNRMKPQLL